MGVWTLIVSLSFRTLRVNGLTSIMEDTILLNTFIDKRRRHGTTPDDDWLLAELVDRHDRVMVLRAEAVALLKQRGVDVAERVARA